MKVLSIVMLAALSVTGLSHAATPVVLVKYNEQYQGYMALPRLAEVVTAVNSTPNLYWPSARLYKTDPESVNLIEQQRQSLLKRLTSLKQAYLQDGDKELAISADTLYQQLKSWNLAQQLPLALDPDRVRAKPALNPKLRAGQYLLQVRNRPTITTVAGLAENTEIPFLNAADASEYYSQIKPLAGASSSFLYILPAAQQVIQAKIGLWNSQRQDVPAGAVLFVPFEQRVLPAEFENLNQQLIELLQHRVVL